ncbi:putative thiol methyltransferase 2 isoform X2 [Apium graveolens]|uniref:putative thiol methyltransferase 2 isoform X2 n=1 Tax=Apium graveolens TaxID=4045 RepID=UPI003D79D934
MRRAASAMKSNGCKASVDKLRQIVNSHSADGWEKSWREGVTPWDLGQPTPILLHLLQTGSLPKGRALVPGCGSGHDVIAIASSDRYVVGLDISESAIEIATKLSSSSPSSNHHTFLKTDFFTWQPTELFDLVFDYTFFCAIEPDMRSAWASRIQNLLKPNGELITLMFPVQLANPLYCITGTSMLQRLLISDHVGGPPYKVSVADYEEVLHSVGFRATSIMENELAIGPRQGREKLGSWKRTTQSLL